MKNRAYDYQLTNSDKEPRSRTEQPASAAGSELWPFCAKDEHEYCAGEAQLTRKGPPSRCGCACHEHEPPAPATQETGEQWHASFDNREVLDEESRLIAVGSNPLRVAQIVRDHNEHQSLSAEREKLRAALRFQRDALNDLCDEGLSLPPSVHARLANMRDDVDAALNEQGKESQ